MRAADPDEYLDMDDSDVDDFEAVGVISWTGCQHTNVSTHEHTHTNECTNARDKSRSNAPFDRSASRVSATRCEK